MSDNSSPSRPSPPGALAPGAARLGGDAAGEAAGKVGAATPAKAAQARRAGKTGSSGSGTRVSSSRAADAPFRFVDQYGLLVCLGEGGMGEVWAARDPKAPKNRIVALKLTKQQGAEAAKVLWDEARIASLIDHPNVCRVHELGMADGLQYLVMDYCDGGSLHDLLERLPGRILSPGYAARIVANVGAGLHAAHELCDEHGEHMGVVHRDVSPQNVLISTAGGVTVADFGVARAAGQAHKATETGEMKGKLSYMAPEQVTSRDIDRRVDVFALGCVLYQVTLGKRPFHGEDALATLYQLLEKDLVRPSALDPTYPPQLEQVVLKALAKNRDERFATAQDLQVALERFLVDSGQQVTDSDVARLLAEKMGTEVTARKEEIRRRALALEAAPPKAPAAAERLETEAGMVSEAPPPARTSLWVRLAAVAVFVAIAGGSVFLIRERPKSEPNSPSAGSAPATNSTANQGDSAPDVRLAQVRFTVLAQPPDARIELDGREVGIGRYQGSHRTSSDLHRLTVTSPGYETQSREVDFEESRSVEIALKPLAGSAQAGRVTPAAPTRTGGAPSGRADGTQQSSAPRPAVTSTQTNPSSKSGATPGSPSGKKPPRSLDSTNPFSTP